RALSHRRAPLRRQHDPLAPIGKRLADDDFGLTGVIHISRIEEVDPRIDRLVHDADRVGGARLAAEHHRPETDGRNVYARGAEITVLHAEISFVAEALKTSATQTCDAPNSDEFSYESGGQRGGARGLEQIILRQ